MSSYLKIARENFAPKVYLEARGSGSPLILIDARRRTVNSRSHSSGVFGTRI